MLKVLCVITARSGSKSIKNKNIKNSVVTHYWLILFFNQLILNL